MIVYIHFFLTILLLGSGLAIFITSHNPVRSVLFLILTFCTATAILFLFEIEFLGFLFLMIYVGAVAVLFLFVVMMINMKITKNKNTLSKTDKTLFVTFIILILLNIDGYIKKTYHMLPPIHYNTKYLLIFDNINEMDMFGQLIFNHYYIPLVIAGFILLVALLGSIYLTFPFKELPTFNPRLTQLSRENNSIHHFYKKNN